ncbi:hypothetical protein GCM10010116_26760 [Microbispora rosea subsp. aerata]|nr:hypothetical protein GCM10010116_26760 [Microbispora rosea subsp. aerata]GIH58484.1 hypothetical protein Mro02_53980 [Microbispora rosea subsp. aerata]GLJ86669.1 hypothetical protein GCM10017588_54070 [Microbispora rosea subsp. aerata]
MRPPGPGAAGPRRAAPRVMDDGAGRVDRGRGHALMSDVFAHVLTGTTARENAGPCGRPRCAHSPASPAGGS